jgi:hypothetical protein
MKNKQTYAMQFLVAYNLVKELAAVDELKHHVNLRFASSNLQKMVHPNISHRPFTFLPVPHRSQNYDRILNFCYFQQLWPE